MSPETGAVLKQFKNELVGTEDKKGHFVGLFIHDKYVINSLHRNIELIHFLRHICACTSTGDLSYTPLDSTKSTTDTVFDLGSDLEIMRGHPTSTHIFAIGGKERDLCIYDIEAIIKAKKQDAEAIDAAGPNKNTSIHKKKSNRSIGLIFQAKNVKNDFLDLQQPIWIHDLQFVNKAATKLAVATHYHQVS
jgi:ribosome biogenesis protein NSA1